MSKVTDPVPVETPGAKSDGVYYNWFNDRKIYRKRKLIVVSHKFVKGLSI